MVKKIIIIILNGSWCDWMGCIFLGLFKMVYWSLGDFVDMYYVVLNVKVIYKFLLSKWDLKRNSRVFQEMTVFHRDSPQKLGYVL